MLFLVVGFAWVCLLEALDLPICRCLGYTIQSGMKFLLDSNLESIPLWVAWAYLWLWAYWTASPLVVVLAFSGGVKPPPAQNERRLLRVSLSRMIPGEMLRRPQGTGSCRHFAEHLLLQDCMLLGLPALAVNLWGSWCVLSLSLLGLWLGLGFLRGINRYWFPFSCLFCFFCLDELRRDCLPPRFVPLISGSVLLFLPFKWRRRKGSSIELDAQLLPFLPLLSNVLLPLCGHLVFCKARCLFSARHLPALLS